VGIVTLRDGGDGAAALRLAAAASQVLPAGGVAGLLSSRHVALILPGFDGAAARAFARRLASTFPNVRVGSASAEPSQPPRGPADLIGDAERSAEPGRRRILVVEDEPELAQIVEAFLSTGGFEVAIAHSGAEALARCREEEPALVVVDLELPDVEGTELVRRIRELVKDLPAVACSGKRPESAAGAGFSAFFRKPFDVRSLVAEVDRVLQARVLGVP
jgi:CheY-like chemotaxis protein